MSNEEIKIYYSIYSRRPNTLVKYTEEDFTDGVGHEAKLVIAHFLDKNKKPQQMVARVIWK